MELKLYDTLTKEKRVFTPLDPGNVRLYVCGPTVYDFAHIGNARPVIIFDVLFRLLQHLAKQGVWDNGKGKTKVTYVRNITDVDDKINDRAARDYPGIPLNEAIRKVTGQTEKQFHEDVAALGCLPPTVEPRATEHIPEMRAIIEKLIAGGHAYVGEDHVLFSVASMPEYGRLARRTLDEMLAGARVDVAPYKREAMDFVLWKPSKPGEPAWASPAGIKTPGRPGWHLECSAMSDRWLWTEAEAGLSASGKAHPHQFDIHGGGVDLVFPHHENEIAQSCCAFHTSHMARTWMHNGFLMVEGEKMSKSLGNFVTIHDLLHTTKFGGRKWPGEVLRLAMLKTHYRSPIDWTVKALEESSKAITDWRALIAGEAPTRPSDGFLSSILDDLNTPGAIAELHRLASAAGRGKGEDARQLAAGLLLLGFTFYEARITEFESAHFALLISGAVGPGIFMLFSEGTPIDAARQTIRSYSANEILIEEKLAPVRLAGATVTTGDVVHIWANLDQINQLTLQRAAARARKDFKESDRIRDELLAMGVVLKDGKDAQGNPVTTWEVKR